MRNPGGEYNQLATTLLQIENEFYGTIRPKRVIRPGERPLHALRQRGVEYVEVRCLDLDPFAALGIDTAVMRFVDLFLLHSLLSDSPPDTPQEIAALARNQDRVANRGREPGLMLEQAGREVPLAAWAAALLAEFEPLAEALDAVHGGAGHRDGLAAARAALDDSARLPSARVLHDMRRAFDGDHAAFMRAQSAQTRLDLLGRPWSPARSEHYDRLAQASWRDQQRMEREDSEDFESWRLAYLSPERLRPAP